MKKNTFKIKALSAIFAVVLCLSCFSSFAFAATTPILSVSSVEGAAGDIVTVSVFMSGNPGIAGMKVLLNFDKSVLTPVSANSGSGLGGIGVTTNLRDPSQNLNDLDFISFFFYGTTSYTGNGEFFNATFRINKDTKATSSIVSVVCREATNQDLDDISVNTTSGMITIKEAAKEDDKTDSGNEAKATIKLRTKASKIKYMPGRSSGNFEPDANATRYEVVECFWNLFEVDVMVDPSKSFKDVSTKYNTMVNLFAAAGVIKGYDDGTFKGDKTITRAEFCVLITNLMGLDISKARDQGFPDVKGNNWYVPYVNACAKAGYVKGRDTGNFDPNGLITRAEVATLINRITGADVESAVSCAYSDVNPAKWYFKQVAAAAK